MVDILVFINIFLPTAKRAGVLATDPHGIRLVDPGRARKGPLGQGADRNQTAHDRQGLLTLADAFGQGLVAVSHRLDRVVPVLGEHTRLELTDNLGALTGRTDILGGRGTHTNNLGLADVRVARAILPTDRDPLARNNAGVTRTYMGVHCYYSVRKYFRPEYDPTGTF